MNDEFLSVVASTLPLFTYDQTAMCSCQALYVVFSNYMTTSFSLWSSDLHGSALWLIASSRRSVMLYNCRTKSS